MATATLADGSATGVMVPEPFRVSVREQDTADTWTLTLEPVSGSRPSIGPGQFMMVTAFGIGEAPISVSGPANRPGPVILTVRAVGAVTRSICAAEPGALLGLRGPFGNTWPIEAAAGGDVVVLAGGIGLAPLRSVVLLTVEEPAGFASAALLYGARTPDDLLYAGQLEEWSGTIPVGVTVDTAGPEWQGRVGVVTQLLGDVRIRPGATAFVCGPEIMMRFAAQALLDRGLPPGRIFVSMERHMDCGVGLCGHCQLGPTLICRDGPVYSWEDVAPWLEVREL